MTALPEPDVWDDPSEPYALASQLYADAGATPDIPGEMEDEEPRGKAANLHDHAAWDEFW